MSPEPLAADPAAWARRVLVMVTGRTPQVVTETLYALAVMQRPPWVPTEVHLVTTSEGQRLARLMLCGAGDGQLERLRRDYGLPAIRFDEGTIHVPTGADGRAIEDIVTEADSTAMADTIVALLRELTDDPHCAIHASIAGGRKTMGFFMGYAMSLFGRPQDRLSHVLVSPPFESDHQFYYPPPKPQTLIIRDQPVSTADARVVLAGIPFVRLRHGLDETLGRDASYSEVVARAQAALGPPELVIDPDNRTVRAGDAEFRLPPAELAFLSWLARRKSRGLDPVTCPPEGAPDAAYAEEYLQEYRHITSAPDMEETTLRNGMQAEFFQQRKSKLTRALRRALGPEGAERYGVVARGRRPRRFELAVDGACIHWAGGA